MYFFKKPGNFQPLSNSLLQPDSIHTTEQEPVQLTGIHDSKSFHLVYDDLSPIIYGALLKMTADEAVAHKLLHKSWIIADRCIRQYDPAKESLLHWLLCIARKEGTDFLRQHDPQPGKTALSQLACLLKENTDATSGQVCAKMLELVYYKGCTASTIADFTGIDEPVVRANIRTALKNVSNRS